MSSPRSHRRSWFGLATLAGTLLSLLVSGQPAVAGAQPSGPPPAVAAQPAVTHLTYMPLLESHKTTGVNIVNGAFEDPRWYTDYTHAGNQWPYGWTFHSTENHEVMPFPTKHQEGNIIPAIAGGWGEYVHKLANQLPKNEYRGAVRGLIIDGYTTYKAFSAAIPQALVLSQVLTGTPGALMWVDGYILGETFDNPTPPNTKLEDDHWVASVQLGNSADTRYYVDMIKRNEVPGNERHWNHFVVYAVIPPSGQLTLKVITQQNWAGRTDFFIDAFNAYQLQ